MSSCLYESWACTVLRALGDSLPGLQELGTVSTSLEYSEAQLHCCQGLGVAEGSPPFSLLLLLLLGRAGRGRREQSLSEQFVQKDWLDQVMPWATVHWLLLTPSPTYFFLQSLAPGDSCREGEREVGRALRTSGSSVPKEV